MTNDQFLFFPMLSYSYKNTVGAVARLFFSDPPLTPHANFQESIRHCTASGRDCYSSIGQMVNTCQYADCEGLYADVDFENATRIENVKDKMALESLMQAYNAYKDSYVPNWFWKECRHGTIGIRQNR